MTLATATLATALAAIAIFRPSAARAACVSITDAAFSLPATAGAPMLPVLVDGRAARFVLDTGADRSLLTAAAVARLGLPGDTWTSTAMRGIGGIERHRDAQVLSVVLAGVALRRRLGPVRSLPVVPTLANSADGLLGADLLAGYDLELTGGGLTVLLQHAAGCADLPSPMVLKQLFPWAEAVAPSLAVRPGLFIISVRLGGQSFRALIDTGATISIVSLPAAARLGVDRAALGEGRAATAAGIGPAHVPLRLHDFGPVTLPTPAAAGTGAIALGAGPLWVGALPPRAFDLILGMDRLRSVRLALSHATGTVVVARLTPHTD